MKKVFFVFNPTAGKGIIKSKIYDIVDIFIKGGYEVMVHPTQSEDDGYRIVKERASEFDLIVCSGGDGTLDEIVTAIMESKTKVPLGYIPSGSTNDFANSLDISKDPIKAAQAIMDGEVHCCDIGMFNHTNFVYIAAFGLFTDVSYATDQHMKNLLGHLAYLLEGSKRIFNIPTYWVRVETEDAVYEGEYIYGMISNSRSVGGFRTIFGSDVRMDDGLFEIMLIPQPKNPIELNNILSSLITPEKKSDYIQYAKAKRIIIDSEDTIAWTLDGEYGGRHNHVEIENWQHALNIMLDTDNIQACKTLLQESVKKVSNSDRELE